MTTLLVTGFVALAAFLLFSALWFSLASSAVLGRRPTVSVTLVAAVGAALLLLLVPLGFILLPPAGVFLGAAVAATATAALVQAATGADFGRSLLVAVLHGVGATASLLVLVGVTLFALAARITA